MPYSVKNCTTPKQQYANAVGLGSWDNQSQDSTEVEVVLGACRGRRFAFICHAGVRSLTAAQTYADMMRTLFPDDVITEGDIVSVDGGTQEWYESGRAVEFGYNAQDEVRTDSTCADLDLATATAPIAKAPQR